jgi:hypothetical protein
MALRRRFNLTERVKLDVRAEYFNVFNHPMFGGPGSGFVPDTCWCFGSTPDPTFGKITPIFNGGTMNASLGGQSPLYAQGGPRSGQFTLKLTF